MECLLLHGDIDMNCYVILDGNECFIVDPGYEKERIQQFVKERNLLVKGILLTHAHHDHIGALDVFDVPIYLHEKEVVILKHNLKALQEQGVLQHVTEDVLPLWLLSDGDLLSLNTKQIEVIHTPGHTPGGVCYKDGNELYSGDTLFRGTVGYWHFMLGSEEEMKQSLFSLLEQLDESVVVYPGHDESTTIGYEKQYNDCYVYWKKEQK